MILNDTFGPSQFLKLPLFRREIGHGSYLLGQLPRLWIAVTDRLQRSQVVRTEQKTQSIRLPGIQKAAHRWVESKLPVNRRFLKANRILQQMDRGYQTDNFEGQVSPFFERDALESDHVAVAQGRDE